MSSLNDGTKNLQGWNNDCHVQANYVFLDEAERKKFALSSHDYLIDQVNRNAFTFNKFVTKPITNGFLNRAFASSDLDDFFETKKLIPIQSKYKAPKNLIKNLASSEV